MKREKNAHSIESWIPVEIVAKDKYIFIYIDDDDDDIGGNTELRLTKRS